MPNPKRNNRFWTVKAEETAGGKIGHLYLYGIIASKTWMGDEVTPALFREDIASLGDIQQLVVHIFSDGGDYFAGNDIYALLKQEKAEIITYGEGIVASIATMPWLAGDKVYISRNAHVLIHNVMFLLQGNYNKLEMQDMIRHLERFGETLIAAYQARTGWSREETIAIMDGENQAGTWFTAQEAIDMGLADGFIPEESEISLDAVACIGPDAYSWNGYTFDLSAYKNAPKINNRRTEDMKKPEANKKAAATPPRAKTGTAITITDPACGNVFDWMPDDTKLVNSKEDPKAVIYAVTCPECGETFEWDAEAGEEVIEEDETAAKKGGTTDANQKANVVSGNNTPRMVAQMFSVNCPECWNTFMLDTGNSQQASNAQATGGVSVKAQVYTVTCPECGATFECDTNPPVPAREVEVEMVEPEAKAGAEYQAGRIAERQRIAALNKIAQAAPTSCANIVAQAIENGWSYERTSKAVFNEMAKTGNGSHLDARANEIKNSGAAGVSAAPNSGTGNTSSATAQAVGSILAGVKTNKK